MTSSHRNGSKSKLSEIKENWPEFTKACKEEGQFNRFLDLAKIPGILEHQDERTKKTCLHFACENKNIKTLKWILNNFARLDQIINLTDSLNRSAIFFAARSSFTRCKKNGPHETITRYKRMVCAASEQAARKGSERVHG